MKNTKIGETKTIGFTVSGKNLSYNAVVVGKHWFKKNGNVEKSEWDNQSVVFEFDENGLKKHHSVIEKNGDVRTEFFFDEGGNKIASVVYKVV